VRRIVTTVPRFPSPGATSTLSISARISGSPRPRVSLRGARHDPSSRTVTSTVSSLRAFRGTLRRWLAAAGSTQEEQQDVTMAANEAIQNAIEHGHRLTRRSVEVSLVRGDGSVEVTVRDQGTWRPPRDDTRGRGLPLMRALMDSVDIEPGEGGRGTIVTLRRALGRQEDGLTNGTKRTGSSSSRTTPDDPSRERTSRSSPSPATGATSRPPAAS